MKLWAARETWLSKSAANKADKLVPKKIKKIAIIKHAALGDMIQVRPMLITLKKAFPNAELTLSVVSNYMFAIPEDLVDRVHIAKGNDKKYGFREILSSYKSLGTQDIIFDVSATSRSFWVTKLNSAGLKIGYIHKALHRLLYDIAIPRSYYRFEGETFLEQVNTIGIQYEWPLRYNYPIPTKIRNKPYIVYFPTSSALNKCWPAEYMIELINNSCKKYPNIDHVLLSGLAKWEVTIANSIASKVNEKNNFFTAEAGTDSFPLVCHANAIVINDTGLRHLAIAADVPTVCIFPLSPHIFSYSPLFGNHQTIVANEQGPATVDDAEKALDKIMSK